MNDTTQAVTHVEVDLPWETVSFGTPTGAVPTSGALPGPGAAVAVAELALLFANPARDLHFLPRSVWRDVRLDRTLRPWPQPPPGASGPELIPAAFRAAVARAVGEAECVAVSFSAGLDSLALLHQVSRLPGRADRRLVVVVCDLTDDLGAPVVPVADRLIEALGIDCERVIVPEGADGPEPEWSWLGPRGDGMPRVNRRIADEAAARGADRLLVGSGADEVLQSGAFLAAELARAHRWRALPSFLRDMQVYAGAQGVLRELASMASPRMSAARSFPAALGMLFPGTHQVQPSGVLSGPLARHAERRHEEWLEEERALFEAHRGSWSAYSAFHAVCPRPLMPPDSSLLPVVEPFLDAEFCATVASVPLDQRYDERLGSAYHRLKAEVLALLPADRRPALPRRKQTFGRALERYPAGAAEAGFPLCAEVGLLPGPRLDGAGLAEVGLIARAVETWLSGAVERGAELDTTVP